MTTLPPPSPSDWTHATHTPQSVGYTLSGITGHTEITITHLVPGHPLTLTLRARPTRDCIITAANQVRTYRANTWTTHTITLTAADTLTISIAGTPYIHILDLTITDNTPIPPHPTPAHVLSLQAHFPTIGLNGGRFDTSRWNRDAYTTGQTPTNTGTWNIALWDAARFHSPNSTTTWQDITHNVTAITTTRGVTSTGPVLAANIGTLTIEALDDLDPRALGLTHATPIKLIHWPTRQPIFTGTITNQEIIPEPPGSPNTYRAIITASDAVARLSSTTRHGARAETYDGSETWTQRLHRLMRTAPEIPYTIQSPSMTRMCATVWETSLTNYLDALAASVAGSWHITRENHLTATAARPTTHPTYTITDARPTNPATRTWSYTAANLAWRASETISSITLTNHATTSENGEHRALDTTHTEILPGAHAAWAGTDATADTTLTTGHADAARALLRSGTDLPIPQSLTLAPCHDYGPTNRADLMANATTFDPITPVRVEAHGDTYPAIITTITHTITPHTWQTDLTLAPNR